MKVQNEIRKILIRNSLVTYAAVVIAVVAMIMNHLSTRAAIEESRKYLYMVRESGEIVPMEYMNRRENLSIEVKHHLQMLVDNFYNLNQFNWEEKSVNRAFWLGDMEKIHIARQNKGYYNRFIQYNIEQEANLWPQNIEVAEIDGKFHFKIMIDLKISQSGGGSTKWVVFAKGIVTEKTRNFPHNPHGLWISDFIEEQIVEIKE